MTLVRLGGGRALLLVLAAATSCKASRATPDAGGGGSITLPDGGTLPRSGLLRVFGECALSGYRELESSTIELDAATSAASTAAGPETRAAAQAAWRKAIDAWQRVEVFQLGPAGMLASPGGQDLRDAIYPWPLGGRCLVEQLLVSEGYKLPTFASGLPNTRGLLTAEYLMFYEGTDNACGATASINANGQWAALGAALSTRKAAYARVVAADVLGRARALVEAWDPARGNYLDTLATAGAGSKIYATDHMAFNAVSDGLFVLDDVKDMKVARPAGITSCATPTCPEALESQWAGRSKEHVRNNLIGVRSLLRGCGAGGEGIGFDDLLRGLGQSDLAQRIDAALDRAFAALDAMKEADFREALASASGLDSMRALHAAIKALTDILKTEFVSILDLELPRRIEGDND